MSTTTSTTLDAFTAKIKGLNSKQVIEFSSLASQSNISHGTALRAARKDMLLALRHDEALRLANAAIVKAMPEMRNERADVRSTVNEGLRFAGLAIAAGQDDSPLLTAWNAFA